MSFSRFVSWTISVGRLLSRLLYRSSDRKLVSWTIHLLIAVPIQMRYNITSTGVGARQYRALTGVLHVNENRYI
jgi:hypothetical protein